MMLFIGKTLKINLKEVHDKTVLKVIINRIKAKTSEPSDNKNRKPKEKQQKLILIEFDILNQPTVSYSFHVYQGKEIIFEEIFFSAVTVMANKNPKVGKEPKQKMTNEENYHQPGKYQIIWDCTDNNVFYHNDYNQKLLIKIQAIGDTKQIAIAESEILIKEFVEHAEVDNYIIVKESEGEDRKLFGSQIIERQKNFVSKIPKKTFDKLSEEGKLILNLPIIMTKLNFLHGALCQIHWLEGSKSSLKFPYEFFMSEKRVEDVDSKNLFKYFKELNFLSADNLGFTPNNSNGENLFLFNQYIDSIEKALNVFNKNLNKRTEDGEIGNYDNLVTEINEELIIKENLFQSFSMGSQFGNIDDVGIALGMYSQRCYFKASISKNQNSNKWILSIKEVACRFFDEYSFNDNLIDFGPIVYSQPLGCWHPEIDKPKEPHYTKFHKPDGLTVCLQNKDYQELKKSLSRTLTQSCSDFYIYSDLKIFNDDFLQKDILIL